MTIVGLAYYGIITGCQILPALTGPILAVIIIGASFAYGFATCNKRKTVIEEIQQKKDLHETYHHQQQPSAAAAATADINHDPNEHDYNCQQK